MGIIVLLAAIGVLAIVVLVRMAVLRARRLSVRIDEVREEMARDPRPPYAALAELLQERDKPRNQRK